MKDISERNHEMLRRVLQILEGEKDQPGLMARVNEHDIILRGRNGEDGLIQKVSLLWRSWVWVLCVISSIVGIALKTWIFK